MSSSNAKVNSKWNETLETAQKWLLKCLNDHPTCRSKVSEGRLPTRVIDVGPSDGSEEPYLFITAASVSSTEHVARQRPRTLQGDPSFLFMDSFDRPYVALSYCWGSSQNYLTTLENIEQMKAGIRMEAVPLTIRDAIEITRLLRIRYLWVDALCIIQDSPDDWHIESQKMAEVYGGAFLTIAAALGASSHHGLSIRSSFALTPPYPLQEDPLYSRAWALQERMLSPRILIFGSQQIYWECDGHQRGSNGVPLAPLISQRIKADPRFEDWHLIVQSYTSREMTREEDKLPALYGLASLYQQRTNDVYLAGLWRSSIIVDLLWMRDPVQYGNRVPFRRPQKYRAPSWSWAAMDGNVTYWHFDNLEPRTRYNGYYHSSGMDCLILSGPLLPARTIPEIVVFNMFEDSGMNSELMTVMRDGKIHGAQNSSFSIDELWFLLLGIDAYVYGECSGYGLILSKNLLSEKGIDSFRRIGVFEIPPNIPVKTWEDIFDGCQDSDLVLI